MNTTEIKFNINETVKVKLTEIGINHLKRRRKDLNEHVTSRGGVGFGELIIKTDENGYTSFQLWDLMNTFGEFMGLGSNPPFKTEIIIDTEKGDPL
jgi:hypothetical protein